MSYSDLEQLLLKAARVSLRLDATEGRVLAQAVEASKAFFQDKGRRFVHTAAGLPLLCSYSNDGTPIKARKHVVARAGGVRVRRHGGASHEYLVQRLFLAYRSGGQMFMDTVLTEPTPLVRGKALPELFNCGRTLFPMIRALGHPGIV